MKKVMALLLALVLLMGAALTGALAEEAAPSNGGRDEDEIYQELIVGTTTAFSGNFLGDMWGSNTSDIDVRTLIHAYSLTDWKAEESSFAVNQTVVSGLIAETDSNGDRLYFVSLADGLKYSDETEITAKDYVFSLLLSTSKELEELGAIITRLGYVKGAEEYMTGLADYAAGERQVFSGIRLYGEKNFSVTIKAEYLPFFYELGLLSVNPYPIEVIAPGCEVADDGNGAYIRNIDPELEEPLFTAALLEETLLGKDGYVTYPKVTSGAYRLTGYDPEKQVATFEMNPYFAGDHQGRKPVIDRLVYKLVHADDMFDLLQDGSVDLLNKCVQAETIREGMEMRASAEGFSMQEYMRSGLGFVSFNCEQGPAQFQPVREALTLCLDRDRFIEEQVDSFGIKVNGYYGMGQWMTQLVNGSLPPPLPELSETPTAAEQAEYDEAAAAWEALTLDNLEDYSVDLERAKALLVEDGWLYNEEGKAFDPDTDIVRAKIINHEDGTEELMLLDMTLIVPEEGDSAVKFLDMQENMLKIGAKLTIQELPYADMLKQYYRQEPRENDMFFLGANFTMVFDPSGVYSIYDEDQGERNTTGLRDEKLMGLALDLNRTEEGDVFTYVQKWIAFQEYWNEVLPLIPIYSNIYFDFYTNRLQDYYINQHITWGEASLYAMLSDSVVEETEETEDALTDGLGEDMVVPFGAVSVEEGSGLILP